MKKETLLIIDPQQDFCNPNGGALFVNGADTDMKRLADMIKVVGNDFDNIVVTIDSHNIVDIAHPVWWVDENGNHPNPFTIITRADVENKKWITRDPAEQLWSEYYVTQLAVNGKYPLCIWPYHCIIGTEGNNIVPVLNNELIEWEKRHAIPVGKFIKGTNVHTEHYSAVEAEVKYPHDNDTEPNIKLINALMPSDLIFVAGEALSHCVANTVRDLMKYIPAERFVLIRDAMSNVTGFETNGDDFIAEFKANGGGITTTEELKNVVNG